MIIVPAPDHFIAIIYPASDNPDTAHICLYEDHGMGAAKLTPIKTNGSQLTVPVKPGWEDTVELLAELRRVLPLAVSVYTMHNNAENAHLFRPEDAGE